MARLAGLEQDGHVTSRPKLAHPLNHLGSFLLQRFCFGFHPGRNRAKNKVRLRSCDQPGGSTAAGQILTEWRRSAGGPKQQPKIQGGSSSDNTTNENSR